MSLHFVSSAGEDDTSTSAATCVSARSTLSLADELLAEVQAEPRSAMASHASIVEFIRDLPGCDDLVDDDPNKFPQTTLLRSIQREPPLSERKPLQFEHFKPAALEAAFTLQIGGITSEQMHDLEQSRLAEKKRKKAEKQAKKDKKRDKKLQRLPTAGDTPVANTPAD
jgi:hypothetical protein